MKAAQVFLSVLVVAAAVVCEGAQVYEPDADVYLIKGGMVYAPAAMGKKDVLVAFGKIQAILEPGQFDADFGSSIKYEVIDAKGLAVGPGWIDCHTHPMGRDHSTHLERRDSLLDVACAQTESRTM